LFAANCFAHKFTVLEFLCNNDLEECLIKSSNMALPDSSLTVSDFLERGFVTGPDFGVAVDLGLAFVDPGVAIELLALHAFPDGVEELLEETLLGEDPLEEEAP
jgi:hypothetical protein